MNLKRLDFSAKEKSKKYTLTTFTESKVRLNFLNEIAVCKKIPSGNFYKFGVIDNGNYYWLFNGVSVANSRDKMIELFSALNAVTQGTEITPFAYKFKLK